MEKAYRIIGKSVPRVDGVEKVTGAARYAGDLVLPGMLHGKLVRSPHAHARILAVRAEKALKLPGVRGVATGKDGPGTLFGFLPQTRDRLALPIDKVRYVGEEVAAVAADTPEIAARAADLVEVEYEVLPAVFDPEEAMAEGAPQLHNHVKNNVSAETHMNFGDVEEGFARSDLIREDTYRTQAILHGFIEPHAVVAQWGPGEKVTLWASKQSPYIVYRNLSRALNLKPSQVRIIQPHIGGGFGGKHEPFGLDFAAVLLSRKTGRPVKIVLDQEEIFFSGQRRHAMIIHVKLGLKRDGTIMACQMKLIADGGSYASVGQLSIYLPGSFLPIPLRVPNVQYDAYRAYTNKPFSGALRGHCIPQMRFALEGLLDVTAEELGIDPVDIRLKNAVHSGETTVNGFKITSCGLTETIEKAAQAAGWREKRGKRHRVGSKVRGVGMATNSLCSGSRLGGHDASSAIIKIHEDGAASLLTGSTDVGQGAMTVLSQILAEDLGLDMKEVTVASGDSESIPLDPGTYGSRVTFCSGNAVLAACRDIKDQIFAAVAPRLGTTADNLELGDHRVYVKEHPDQGMPWIKAVREAFYTRGQPVIGRGTATPGTEMADFITGEGNLSAAYSFGTQVAEVEVDLETGQVRVLKFIVSHDCGYPINPALMDGQLHGSVVHGMAQVLGEDISYLEGLPLTTSLTEYGMPTAADAPRIETIHVNTKDEMGPYGAKESGEGSMISTLACVSNAIYDATGVRIKEIPVTPPALLRALKKQALEVGR